MFRTLTADEIDTCEQLFDRWSLENSKSRIRWSKTYNTEYRGWLGLFELIVNMFPEFSTAAYVRLMELIRDKSKRAKLEERGEENGPTSNQAKNS
jgi:hypothetical protein